MNFNLLTLMKAQSADPASEFDVLNKVQIRTDATVEQQDRLKDLLEKHHDI